MKANEKTGGIHTEENDDDEMIPLSLPKETLTAPVRLSNHNHNNHGGTSAVDVPAPGKPCSSAFGMASVSSAQGAAAQASDQDTKKPKKKKQKKEPRELPDFEEFDSVSDLDGTRFETLLRNILVYMREHESETYFSISHLREHQAAFRGGDRPIRPMDIEKACKELIKRGILNNHNGRHNCWKLA